MTKLESNFSKISRNKLIDNFEFTSSLTPIFPAIFIQLFIQNRKTLNEFSECEKISTILSARGKFRKILNHMIAFQNFVMLRVYFLFKKFSSLFFWWIFIEVQNETEMKFCFIHTTYMYHNFKFSWKFLEWYLLMLSERFTHAVCSK